MNDILHLQQLAHRFNNDQPWLFQLDDYRLQAGERLFVHGPSGSGKSTLLNIITGLLSPKQGQVWVNGQCMTALNQAAKDRLRAQSMGIITQTLNLLPYLTVAENLSLMQHFAGQRADEARQEQLLAQLNLLPQRHQTVSQLSLGQQQRAAIARALIHQPALIIADEPTSALDDANRDAFLALLFEQCEQTQAALVLVSHDQRIAPHFRQQLHLSAGGQSC